MKLKTLEDIGFYTLEDNRAKTASIKTPLWRCELILTDKCNFKCPYCRGLRADCAGTMNLNKAKKIIDIWVSNNLKNIRFSGGEPTLYPHLEELVSYAKDGGVERIAISTNGSNELSYYEKLVDLGVNDYSISLDACCSSFGRKMSGGIGGWENIVENIRELSKKTYVTLGMVFTEDTINEVAKTAKFGSSLGVADIRIIPSAQYNQAMGGVDEIGENILNKHPILNYRVKNFLKNRHVRGIKDKDFHKCPIVLDDMAIAGDYHFPCIIYLREMGKPIGHVSENMRTERLEWFKHHNTYDDPICRKNCLDVCIDYNNKYRSFHGNQNFN